MAEPLWRTFNDVGEFAALNAARAWLALRGFSVGPIDITRKAGVMLGDVAIAKFKNLDSEERNDLHGIVETLSPHWRDGPIKLTMRRDAPNDALAAFWSEPLDNAAMAEIEGRPFPSPGAEAQQLMVDP